MISFITPAFLWAFAFAAIPIALHFAGRRRTRRKDFPSLRHLEVLFRQEHRRQSIRDWLLLLVRTLFVLSLVLAFSGITFNKTGNSVPINDSILLVHNDIWSHVHSPGLQQVRSTIDSIGKGFRKVMAIQHDRNPEQKSIRHGNPQEMFSRMKSEIIDRENTALIIPAFNPERWAFLEGSDIEKKEGSPEVILVDMRPLVPEVFYPAPGRPGFTPDGRNLEWPFKIKGTQGGKVSREMNLELWLGSYLNRTVSWQAPGPTNLMIPLSETSHLTGSIHLNSNNQDSLFSRYYYSLENQGPIHILHTGSRFFSLPALGEKNQRVRITHYSNLGKTGSFTPETWNYITLANTDVSDLETCILLRDFVSAGGRLVIIPGDNTGLRDLNNNLAQPLHLGIFKGAAEQNEKPILVKYKGPQKGIEGTLSEATVSKQYPLEKNSSAKVILDSPTGPVLVESTYGKGRAWLWTTNIDNMDWTDLGASPFYPLFNYSMIHDKTLNPDNLGLFGDSLFLWKGQSSSTGLGDSLFVKDPNGLPFERLQQQQGRTFIGPFDQPGHYQVFMGQDTSIIAVNPEPASTGQSAFPKEWSTGEGPISVIEVNQFLDSLSSGTIALWKLAALGAVLMLMAECLIIITFSGQVSSRGNRPGKPA